MVIDKEIIAELFEKMREFKDFFAEMTVDFKVLEFDDGGIERTFDKAKLMDLRIVKSDHVKAALVKCDKQFTILVDKDEDNIDKVKLVDCAYLFYRIPEIKYVYFKNTDMSEVRTMRNMFAMSGVKYIDFCKCDLRNVEDFGYTFFNCRQLEEVAFDTSLRMKPKNMEYMFGGCTKLQYINLSMIDTDEVTDMSNMFSNCIKINNIAIGNFRFDKVEKTAYMFKDCEQLTSLELPNMKVNTIKNVDGMFSGCTRLQSIGLSDITFKGVSESELGNSAILNGCRLDFEKKLFGNRYKIKLKW